MQAPKLFPKKLIYSLFSIYKKFKQALRVWCQKVFLKSSFFYILLAYQFFLKILNMTKLAVILMMIPLAVNAQSNYPVAIDSFMTTEVAVNGFNGNVLAARSGNIIYQKAFGYRNYYTRELLDNNSVFDLASISKQFTAAGILLLKDQGKLSLDDSLRKFFPELPYCNINIKQLLTHTSGLPDYIDIMEQTWDKKNIAFNNDVIAVMAKEKVPLISQPGEKWEYCNTGYMLLASIIEKVSGKSYNDFMNKNIFEPLGMTSTRGYNTRRSKHEQIYNYALGFIYSDSLQYFFIPDSIAKYDVVRYLDGVQGDGTINSTTGDLYKWDLALKNSTLLKESTQKEMLSGQCPIYGGYAHYGYGVMINNNDPLGLSISHTGTWPGYKHYMVRYVDSDITIIVLTNNNGNPGVISSGIAQIMKDKPFEFSYIHKEITIDTSLLKKYTGHYFLQSSGPAELFERNGRLILKIYGGMEVECKPESDNKFFYKDPINKSIATFEFEKDNTGNIQKIYHILNLTKTEVLKQ
jgi:CubicO group peptidase (beta-lactamase class C family)